MFKKNTSLYIMLLLVNSFLIFNFDILFSKANDFESNDYKTITIEEGDTLWQIAKSHKPDNIEIREFIYNIKMINDMDTSMIKTGQKIMIPYSKRE